MSEPINLNDFEAPAAQRIPKMVYDFYAAGANDQLTLRENRAAFERIQLLPRMLRDVSQRDMSTTILGKEYSTPLLIAPMAAARLAHEDGEIGIARAAGSLGITMIVSTMATTPMEAIAAAASAPLWFQLYMTKDRAVTRSLVQRAEAAGYAALVLTVDLPVRGQREPDIRNRFHLPDGYTYANFLAIDNFPVKVADPAFGGYITGQVDPSLTWETVDWLCSLTTMPVLVKGVLRADDAQLALEHGASGIMVSNHGGRQLDTVPASIEALPEIVAAVDGKADVLLDGGVRRGTDVIKALALGAKAVAVGRPVLWGLAYDGEAGVQRLLTLLRDEVDLAMALSGCRSLDEITPDLVRLP